MKKAILISTTIFALAASSAHALTNQDVAGIYQGTSVATLSNGQTVTANLTLTLKAKGNIKSVAVVNGQTINGKGKYQFISEHGITESTDGGEAVGFVDLNGSTLTFNLLVRTDNGVSSRKSRPSPDAEYEGDHSFTCSHLPAGRL